MPGYERFEDMAVWQAARELARQIYRISAQGDFARDFGLRDQMRRAAVSVMSNIAEGFESRTQGLFIDFLGRAKASSGEVRAQCYIALDVGYLNRESFDQLVSLAQSCSRQLSRFMSYLEAHPGAGRMHESGIEYTINPDS